jgi:hypothetical protein
VGPAPVQQGKHFVRVLVWTRRPAAATVGNVVPHAQVAVSVRVESVLVPQGKRNVRVPVSTSSLIPTTVEHVGKNVAGGRDVSTVNA